MKNFNTLIVIILTTIVFLLFNSCCKNITCPNLSADDKSWIPYKVNDTLVFKNFESDSVLRFIVNYENEKDLTSRRGYKCAESCNGGFEVGLITELGAAFWKKFTYFIQKSDSAFYVVCSPYEMNTIVGLGQNVNPDYYFALRESNKYDSIIINGLAYNSVYIYSTYSQARDIRQMYIKKGLGILRIDFDDNQNFELIEHIKYKENEK